MRKAFSKKTKTVISALLCLAVAAVLVPVVINFIVIGSAKKYIITPEQAAEKNAACIVVPGAAVWADGRLSHMLEDRVLGAIDLYENGASAKILMSGDHATNDYDEVNSMKRYAVDKGVPPQAILMDHAGFSTYETMYRARDIFKTDSAVIVTQKYHLFRAVYIARRLGIEAYGVASDPRSYGAALYNSTREFLARIKDFFMCIAKPEPTFLGETIPILEVDGSATDDLTAAATTENTNNPSEESTTLPSAENEPSGTTGTTAAPFPPAVPTTAAAAASDGTSTSTAGTTAKNQQSGTAARRTTAPERSTTAAATSKTTTRTQSTTAGDPYPIYTRYVTTTKSATKAPTAAPTASPPLITTRPSAAPSWPTDKFFARVPKCAVAASYVNSYSSAKGTNVVVQFDSMSYDAYLEYLDRLEAAGFKENNSRANVPDTQPEDIAMFFSTNSDICIGVYYYGKSSAAGLDCQIVATDYNPAA